MEKNIKCSKCGSETSGKFCNECGAPLEKMRDFSQNQSKETKFIEDCLKPDKTATRIINRAAGCRSHKKIVADSEYCYYCGEELK